MRSPYIDRRQAVSASLLSLGVAPLSHWSTAAAASEAWPIIGLGTCCEEPAAVAAMVVSGVEAGFRLVDTAAHYPGESGVGDALISLEERGAVRPGEVQVCSKVWFDEMGYEPALSSARGSLARLRRERLDVLLVHFPGSPDARQDPKANRLRRAETWRALETLQADGYVKTIGVSNWTRRHLRETLASCRVPPQLMQTEVHPLLPQIELREDCAAAGIRVMAHCPLAHGAPALLRHPTLRALGEARGATPAQVALRWAVQRGVLPVPHASSAARQRENLLAALEPTFELTPAELARVDALETGERVAFDPGLIA